MDKIGQISTIIANIAIVTSIIIALVQVFQNKKIRKAEFEDNIEKEYRIIIKDLPYIVFTEKILEQNIFNYKLDEFYRYFDFTNGEIVLRKQNKIDKKTWENWRDGIKDNMQKKNIKKAFNIITCDSPNIFNELKKLVKEDYNYDPDIWEKKRYKKRLSNNRFNLTNPLARSLQEQQCKMRAKPSLRSGTDLKVKRMLG